MPNKINPLTGKFDYFQDADLALQEAKAYTDLIALGLLDDRGSFTPSGSFPTEGGSGVGDTVAKGDIWYITGLGTGVIATLGDFEVKDGDTVRALSDAPGQTSANWDVMSSPVNAITVQTLINSRTEQTTPADTDNIPVTDGTNGNAFKRLTWLRVKQLLTREKRHEWTGTYDYMAWADYGTSESSSTWTITRMTISSAGAVTKGVATGSWTNRASLTYI